MINLKRRIGNQHQHAHPVEHSVQRLRLIVVGVANCCAVAAEVGEFVGVAGDEEEFAGGDEAEEVVYDGGCEAAGGGEDADFGCHFVISFSVLGLSAVEYWKELNCDRG